MDLSEDESLECSADFAHPFGRLFHPPRLASARLLLIQIKVQARLPCSKSPNAACEPTRPSGPVASFREQDGTLWLRGNAYKRS
jgi:hypothetical protein